MTRSVAPPAASLPGVRTQEFVEAVSVPWDEE